MCAPTKKKTCLAIPTETRRGRPLLPSQETSSITTADKVTWTHREPRAPRGTQSRVGGTWLATACAATSAGSRTTCRPHTARTVLPSFSRTRPHLHHHLRHATKTTANAPSASRSLPLLVCSVSRIQKIDKWRREKEGSTRAHTGRDIQQPNISRGKRG